MFSVKRGNLFQMITITYFILGNLTLATIISSLQWEVNFIFNILISQLGFVALSVVTYLVVTKSPIKSTLHLHKIRPLDVLICIGLAWSIMPSLSVINVLSQFFVRNQIQGTLLAVLDYPYLFVLLLTSVFPAIFEELLTRSLIISNYRKESVLVTCIISGLFFGFIHLNINQFLYAFVMGALMCYVVLITESIYSAIIIHFTINATSTTMLYVSNMIIKAFSDNEILMGEIAANTDPTNAQLAIMLIGLFIYALFFLPIAFLLLRSLLKGNSKVFKGSLKLPTEVFMGLNRTSLIDHDFQEDMKEALEQPEAVEPLTIQGKQSIFTPPLLITIAIFIVFSLIIEFLS
ncbi:CPBP family intramembrane glutamic endopeptidase [Petrocella sp. FN5]|uniref:CPBP family intramembrane glutamic endopeptidase n=1 Tax=Petrocella sp. FN5 TaxID=3032002 RepID=UPI0023DC3926|nr:type II CAAX endopeptidase family protein [Petrocella sp. FN5]MDF1618362.1 type II CAAX endopeptidase family protein [Petrocella sp. FN5]